MDRVQGLLACTAEKDGDMQRRWWWGCFFLVSFGASAQQSVRIPEEYDKLIQSRTTVGTLGPDLFGDEISFYDGSLQFRQTDATLPGNNDLDVSVGRRFAVKQDMVKQGAFGDWDWEIPRLHGVFSTAGWTVPVPVGQPTSVAQQRCSRYGTPPTASGIGGGSFSAGEFWNGSFLKLAGGGGELLKRGASTPAPTDGYEYPLVTKDGVAIRCLATLAPTSTGTGEGFEAVTPAGIRYRFDHMVWRALTSLTKGSPFPELAMSGQSAALMAPDGYLMQRREVWILPTLVTDRHGNTVIYHWSASEPWKLTSIVASDGRSLSFTYVAGSNRVASVSDGSRTWTYEYQPITYGGRLSAVVQPDGARWTFNLEPLRTVMEFNESAGCGNAGYTATPTGTGTITHPSGAQGSFTVTEKLHGRSQVPLACENYDPANSMEGYSRYPAEFLVPSLISKVLSGPGIASQSWAYAYGPANNCYLPGGSWPSVGIRCATGAASTKTTSVTAPDGAVTRYTFGNRYQVDEGQLLRIDEGWNGSTALRTTINTYAAPNAGPYPNPIGNSIQPRNDGYLGARHTPKQGQVVTQQGTTFTYAVNGFDVHARPISVTRSSAPAP